MGHRDKTEINFNVSLKNAKPWYAAVVQQKLCQSTDSEGSITDTVRNIQSLHTLVVITSSASLVLILRYVLQRPLHPMQLLYYNTVVCLLNDILTHYCSNTGHFHSQPMQ